VHGEISESEKVPVGDGFAAGDNGVVFVDDETMAFMGVEMRAIHGSTEKEGRDEANRGLGNEEGVFENKGAVRGSEFNSSHASGVDGLASDASDWVGLYRAHVSEIRNEGGDVASRAGINNEREAPRSIKGRIAYARGGKSGGNGMNKGRR
jgi:hypothetical protein